MYSILYNCEYSVKGENLLKEIYLQIRFLYVGATIGRPCKAVFTEDNNKDVFTDTIAFLIDKLNKNWYNNIISLINFKQ